MSSVFDREYCSDMDASAMRPLGPVANRLMEVAGWAMKIRPVCESPIETQLGAAVIACLLKQEPHTDLIAQYAFGRYRMDFALQIKGDEAPCIFVECDGAEFHSTPEQIENDRRKDAAAEAAGVTMLRFTGKDIHHRADACARLVMAVLATIAARRESVAHG